MDDIGFITVEFKSEMETRLYGNDRDVFRGSDRTHILDV